MINAQVAIMKRALDLWHLGFSQGILVLGLDNYKSHSTLTVQVVLPDEHRTPADIQRQHSITIILD
jgi:hypothetical protein